MESKLKALKVVDLKAILNNAQVAFPARATKADLIAKILASPSALDAFNGKNSTPDPSTLRVHAPLPHESAAAQPDPEPELEALEELQSEPAVSETPAPPQPPSNPQLPPPEAPSNLPSQEPSSTESPSNEPVDPELEKRKARAARFGIPLVEPKEHKTRQPRQPKAPQSSIKALRDDPDKLKARAERFGIKLAAHSNGTSDPKSNKRAIAEPADEEELARRRKRAERFGSAATT